MRKKIIDFVMQCKASRGRKSKAGGKKIKGDLILYTPGTEARFFWKNKEQEKEYEDAFS